MNAQGRVAISEQARRVAEHLRGQGRHADARKIEELCRREEFAALDEVFDAAADFDTAMARVSDAVNASAGDLKKLENQILDRVQGSAK